MPRLEPSNFPPDWWHPELYDFLKPGPASELPLEGWVWEFMRRQRLKTLLPKGQPIDAMNPSPATACLEANNYAYYYPWPRAKSLFTKAPNKWPYYLSPSVVGPAGLCPKYFSTQYFRVQTFISDFDEANQDFITVTQFPRKQTTFKVDLNRPDSAIKRDFSHALEAAREKYPGPQTITHRRKAWGSNYALQVWDLRSFKVSWNVIHSLRPLFDKSERATLAVEPGIDCAVDSWSTIYRLMKDCPNHKQNADGYTADSVRTIFKRTQELIDKSGWYRLIIQHDTESIP